MSQPPFKYPYPPNTTFIPSTLLISSVTKAYPMVVVATVPPNASNTYIAGQAVRFFIPQPYGMQQLNGQTGVILNVSGLTFTIDINSSLYDAFVTPLGNVAQPASFAPSGSRNLQYSNLTTQVAFQPINSDLGN